MTRPLLVVRPEPGASATVAEARALGLEAIAAPLFVTRPVAWAPPEEAPPALLMTSRHAAKHGGADLAGLLDLPLYAVGEATARAARAAGFSRLVVGDQGIDAIVALAAADGVPALLHLAGRDYRPPENPAIPIARRVVYAADALDALPENAVAALPSAITLFHSPRAASTFAALVDAAGIARSGIGIAALSEATRAAAGPGWRVAIVADRPQDAALLAAAAKLCDQGA